MSDIPLEERFSVLSKITRAQHFAWREAARQMFPDADIGALVDRMWEITGVQTGRAYARRIDPKLPMAPQVAECIGWSSRCMGEDVEVTRSPDEKEGFVKHLDCPWYHWHKKQDLLEEDLQGCDVWFQTTVETLGRELGVPLRVETQKALPGGDACCLRRFWVEDSQP